MDTQTRLALRTALIEQAVRVWFTKKDGTQRKMLCQLRVNRDVGIVERLRELEEICPIDPLNKKAWTVYSLEDDGYRRFNVDSIIMATAITTDESIVSTKEDEYIEAYEEFKKSL
jgi:hypothetical protein